MDNVNKTLYIPLYGKSYVSKKGILLQDTKAEEIWAAEGFSLKGRSCSKWLAYYMGMRSAVFDDWVRQRLADAPDAIVIHIGCGLDSRVIRVGANCRNWYDVDFAEVIAERKRYYSESTNYHMIAGDVRDCIWLNTVSKAKRAVVVMEGVSMYLTTAELSGLLMNLCAHFGQMYLLMDCYTVFAANMSKYKNPINDVGVTRVYGVDEPKLLENGVLTFTNELSMTPPYLIDELGGVEKLIYKKLYAGRLSQKLYRLYEFKKQ